MTATEFSRVVNQFYGAATDVLVQIDAFIDNMIGDEVMAVFIPAFTGPNHARSAVMGARALLDAAHFGDVFEVPIGVGVHTGPAYFGTIMGAGGAFSDLTALGDTVNLAARLASSAAAGEALISEDAYEAAGIDVPAAERRVVEVKGKSEPVGVRALGPEPLSDNDGRGGHP